MRGNIIWLVVIIAFLAIAARVERPVPPATPTPTASDPTAKRVVNWSLSADHLDFSCELTWRDPTWAWWATLHGSGQDRRFLKEAGTLSREEGQALLEFALSHPFHPPESRTHNARILVRDGARGMTGCGLSDNPADQAVIDAYQRSWFGARRSSMLARLGP